MQTHQINWQEVMNGITVDCSLDVAIHKGGSNVVLLIIPGVDGSLDGYENKYLRIAESVFEKHKASVVRMSNPFITSYHWKSNVRRIFEFIEENKDLVSSHDELDIRIMAHSAGAAVIAQIAWEYPEVTRLLLINPATQLGIAKIHLGLNELQDVNTTILVGGDDPSFDVVQELSVIDNIRIVAIEGADHNFSSEHFPAFISSPETYLFS
ncbi:MAG: hypothetical protein JWN75_980 [Candidatus Saccharibacteria bacterium]|nr:hypothetical protein [Candidatus Saccharibacteria bacterium]